MPATAGGRCRAAGLGCSPSESGHPRDADLAAGAKHCAFCPMIGATVAALKGDLKKYDTSKGTVRFPPDRPLPAALVRKLVKARIAESAAREKVEAMTGLSAKNAYP
jgi:hypothetical protein